MHTHLILILIYQIPLQIYTDGCKLIEGIAINKLNDDDFRQLLCIMMDGKRFVTIVN